MHSSPSGSTHGQTTSDLRCHHSTWAATTIKPRWAWHAIVFIEQHSQLNEIRRGMLSSPLDRTHDRTMSGVACVHGRWVTQTIARHRHGLQSSPIDNTHDQTTSSVECHNLPLTPYTSDDVECDMLSSPMDRTHSRATLGVSCLHGP